MFRVRLKFIELSLPPLPYKTNPFIPRQQLYHYIIHSTVHCSHKVEESCRAIEILILSMVGRDVSATNISLPSNFRGREIKKKKKRKRGWCYSQHGHSEKFTPRVTSVRSWADEVVAGSLFFLLFLFREESSIVHSVHDINFRIIEEGMLTGRQASLFLFFFSVEKIGNDSVILTRALHRA